MKKENKVYAELSINKNIFDVIKKASNSFVKAIVELQLKEIVEKSGLENPMSLLDDELLVTNLKYGSVVSAILFAFHSNCYAEETPFKNSPTERELELLNLWTHEMSKTCEVDSEEVSKILLKVAAEYDDGFQSIKNDNFSINHYLNKGLFNMIEEECFSSVAKEHIKKTGSFNFRAISLKVAKKMNYQAQYI